MWNNLRARHYSFLILLAIVTLETSAVAIDRFVNRDFDTAFVIESSFQNNPFIQASIETEEKPIALPLPIKHVVANNATLKESNKESQLSNLVAVSVPVVPAPKLDFNSNYTEYSVKPGDSVSDIAALFGASIEEIKLANNLQNQNKILAGQSIKVPLPTSDLVYTVKRGDSLSRIASRFRIPLQQLIEANNLKSHMLLADQRLKIPSSASLQSQLTVVDLFNQETANEKKLEIVKNPPMTKVSGESTLKIVRGLTPQSAPAPATKTAISASVSAKEEIKQITTAAKTLSATSNNTNEASNKNIDDPSTLNYEVIKGDSLLKIAHKFDTTVAQIQHDNEMNGTMVKIGQTLEINPGKKRYRVVKTEEDKTKKTIANHTVRTGENLTLIAKRYNTTINEIVDENKLAGTMVKAGQILKVPTDQKPKKATWRMPTRGRISDEFGYRNHPIHNRKLFHAGVDIAAPKGTTIAAAMDGEVIFAGRRAGYGNVVILKHENGYSSRYAHCSTINVRKGQMVQAGQLIARVGATGLATGNHVHFEIRKDGTPQNPLLYAR